MKIFRYRTIFLVIGIKIIINQFKKMVALHFKDFRGINLQFYI